MSGFISEFFGYRAEDNSQTALKNTSKQVCPFLSSFCTKALGDKHNRTLSGVCAVRQVTTGSPDVICCPNRIYAENYKMLSTVAQKAFGAEYKLYAGKIAVERAKAENGSVAVFGHGWGGELPLPKRQGKGSYYVDWILAHLNEAGELVEFTEELASGVMVQVVHGQLKGVKGELVDYQGKDKLMFRIVGLGSALVVVTADSVEKMK
jgi:hypothetical protein